MAVKYNSLFISVAIVSTVMLQSSRTSPVECSKPTTALRSLIGDTMCSTNHVPFDWSSDYEVAVIYITSMWSELEEPGQSSEQVGIIAKNGFLVYCVRFKTELAAWAKSVNDRVDINYKVKKAVSSWYQAIDTLSKNNWSLPNLLNLDSFKKTFRTSFKHLVINGAEIYDKTDSKLMKRDVDDFTREIANIMIATLKDITKQVKVFPKKHETGMLIKL